MVMKRLGECLLKHDSSVAALAQVSHSGCSSYTMMLIHTDPGIEFRLEDSGEGTRKEQLAAMICCLSLESLYDQGACMHPK